MLDVDKLCLRMRQFGGWRLLWQYAKMGVLWTGCKALFVCVMRGRSLKEAYPVVTREIDDVLVRRYGGIFVAAEAVACKTSDDDGNVGGCGHKVPHIVWSAWLQGMDKAPEMVQACMESWSRELPGYDIRVVDSYNYHEWVELPPYVVEKYRKGLIPHALFCDLLRLALLKRYGGVWMDASVYCSGFGNEQLRTRWDRVIGSEFTVFRYFRRGAAAPVGLSNWFMAAVPNEKVVSVVFDALLAYWRDYDCTVNYYVMHLFLGMALRTFSDVTSSMPHENSYYSLLLGKVLADDYNGAKWRELASHVSIHKLNYRKECEAKRNPNGFYSHLLLL